MLQITYVIVGTFSGMSLFIIPLWCYRRGLKDGLALTQGKPIEPIQNPVQAVTQHYERKVEAKEAKVINDSLEQGWNNIMTYDGSVQKEVKT